MEKALDLSFDRLLMMMMMMMIIFLSSNVVLTPSGQFWGSATIAFSELYMCACELSVLNKRQANQKQYKYF